MSEKRVEAAAKHLAPYVRGLDDAHLQGLARNMFIDVDKADPRVPLSVVRELVDIGNDLADALGYEANPACDRWDATVDRLKPYLEPGEDA